MVAEVGVVYINLDQLPTSLHLLCPRDRTTEAKLSADSAAKQGDEIEKFRSNASWIVVEILHTHLSICYMIQQCSDPFQNSLTT